MAKTSVKAGFLSSYLKRMSKYEVISFTTGFALMAYELAAARILAPSIGSSTYVWTSVIGVIIAALSLGYAVGGKVADIRVKALDVAWLLLISAFCVALTLTLAGPLLEVLSASRMDPRLQGLFASLILFAPASFVLGMISPYLVRLRVASLETTGESVALLSALNSIGGIIGTFAAGFIFFGFIGSLETVVIVTLILLLSSWAILPTAHFRKRTAVTIIVLAISLLPALTALSSNVVAAIDTPSAHYRVFDGEYNGRPARFLSTGPSGYQSAIYTDNSDDLVFRYTQKVTDIIAEAPQKERILILGGGAFTLPGYLAEQYPDSQIDVVEIDPALEHIAAKYFHYDRPQNVTAIAQDARAFLNSNVAEYDLIVVDVYSDTAIPFPLATKEYGEAIHAALRENGAVIANIIGGNSEQCAPMLEALHSAYTSVLPQSVYFPLIEPSLQQRQNVIAVYANGLDWLDTAQAANATIADTAPMNDNYAPAERLHQKCLAR